jgi:hypothetical protein
MEVFGVDAFQPALVGGKLLNWGYMFRHSAQGNKMKIYCNSLLISKTLSKELLLLFFVTQELHWKIHTYFSNTKLCLAVNYLTVYGIQLAEHILSDRHNAHMLHRCATKQLSNVL